VSGVSSLPLPLRKPSPNPLPWRGAIRSFTDRPLSMGKYAENDLLLGRSAR